MEAPCSSCRRNATRCLLLRLQARLEADRFPAPEVIECEQYGSKARYLTQKLHSDVPLDEFLRGLYKAVVS